MRIRNLAVVFAGILVVPVASAQRIFPDIPENHWVYSSCSSFYKEGLYVLPVKEDRVYRGSTRAEIAAFTLACYSRLCELDPRLEQGARRPGFMVVGAEADKAARDAQSIAKELKQHTTEWQALFPKLIQYFSPDLTKLGADPTEMQHSVIRVCSAIDRCQVSLPGTNQAQFIDVPPTHWAAPQVLELHRLGILTGYPPHGPKPNAYLR